MHDNEIRREKNVLKIKFTIIVGVDWAFVRHLVYKFWKDATKIWLIILKEMGAIIAARQVLLCPLQSYWWYDGSLFELSTNCVLWEVNNNYTFLKVKSYL